MNQVKKVSKKARKEPLHDLATLQRMATQASHRAVQHAGKAGVGVSFIQGDKLMMLNPDNTTSEVRSFTHRPLLDIEDMVCQA